MQESIYLKNNGCVF